MAYRRGSNPVKSFNDKTNPQVRSRTQQSFAPEVNINSLVAKYRVSGTFHDPVSVNRNRVPMWGDFSDLPDFSATMQKLTSAQEQFRRIPAKVRSRFNNDVGELLRFVLDPANVKESVELGLLPKEALPKEEGAAKPPAA